jgi:tRNA/tmRNA/rRNA uracil-C5-methylase (TrmA/RlmC/RlmD family)
MSEQAWYKDWFNSPFYHKLYFERDEKEAAAFISTLIDHLEPAPWQLYAGYCLWSWPAQRILAEKGFNVTGIDISFDSIAFAKKFRE